MDCKENPLECPICYEWLENAYETFCGHSFCEYCLYKALENGNVCPICRKDPSPIHPSYTLRNLVQSKKGKEKEEPANFPCSIKETYLGNLSYRRKLYAEAIKHYTNACSVQPSAVAYGNRGASYFKLKQYRLALEDYHRAEQQEPSNVRLHIGKALTLEKLHQYREAYEEFYNASLLPSVEENREDIMGGIKRLAPYVTASTPFPTAITTLTTPEYYPSEPMTNYNMMAYWNPWQDALYKEFVRQNM